VFLEPGDNIVMGEYGFGAYSIGARACQGEVRFAAEPGIASRVEAVLARSTSARAGVHHPTRQSDRHLPDRRGTGALHAGLPADVVLVIDGAYAEFADDPRFDDGLDLARTAENVVVTRTFSKLHGLAALRIGWMYCPAHIADATDRIRPPFNTSIAAQEAPPSPPWPTSPSRRPRATTC
jgi:histidinol-phosphate aminotransferase